MEPPSFSSQLNHETKSNPVTLFFSIFGKVVSIRLGERERDQIQTLKKTKINDMALPCEHVRKK